MTTAKPQHDQSDAADDLIAELAKLMAKDAQGDRAQQEDRVEAAGEDHVGKAEPAPATNTFSFRLPGDASAARPAAGAPAPRSDFGATGKPAEGSVRPVVSQPVPQGNAEPSVPNFGAASEPAGEQVPSSAAAPAEEHDAIADLIEAELAAEPVARQADDAAGGPVASPAREPRQQGSDSFNVAPVFGLAGPEAVSVRAEPVAHASIRQPEAARQPEPQPQPQGNAGSDPLDAIESLIGDAVRSQIGRETADTSSAAQSSSTPSPALRSLATPVLPTAGQQSQPEPAAEATGAMNAEDAIIAAAAATGAQVGWVDPQDGAEDYAAEAMPPQRAPRRNLRAFAGPAVAVVALLAAGVGLYSVLGLGGPDGPPPVLTADATPVKEVPEAQPAAEAEPESVVFNEIAGTQTPAEDEQLVSRDQSQVAAIAGSPPAADATDEGLVNRKVRTVTVRPDGTIVGSEDALAGVAMLPVERPNVPEVPGAAPPADSASVLATSAPATTGNAPAGAGTTPVETAALNPDAAAIPGTTATDTTQAATAAVPPEALLIPGEPAAVVDAEGNEIAGRTAPVPLSPIQRPSEPSGAPLAVATSPVNALVDPATQPAATPAQQQPAATQTAAVQPTATTTETPAAAADKPDTLAELISAWSSDNQQPAQAAQPAATQTAAAQPAATATASQAPAYVQLSSQRSEEAALQTVNTLQSRYGNLFGGTPLEVQRVDLGERGVYYRVRLPTQSLESATQICNSVKSSGGDCFTL